MMTTQQAQSTNNTGEFSGEGERDRVGSEGWGEGNSNPVSACDKCSLSHGRGRVCAAAAHVPR